MLTQQTNKNKYSLRAIVGLNASDSILLAIIQAGEDGISGKDLELRSGVSRITIWKQRVRLRDYGLIYYKTKGRRTMYYPTKLAIDNLYFQSWTRYSQLLGRLESRRISIYSPFYEIKFPNYLDYKPEITILQFALRMGILLTYILIQYLRPMYRGSLNHKQRKISRGFTNRLIEESVRTVISPVKILTILRQTLYALNYRFLISTAKKSDKYSFYMMESKSFDDLVTAFSKVFPQAFKDLETINFGDAEYRARQRIEYSKKRKEQLKCKHRYQIEIMDKIESYYCPICKFTSRIDRDIIIDNEDLVGRLNIIKPHNDNCRNHRWRIMSEKIPFVLFECALCWKIAELPIESEEKLATIREQVETDNRFKIGDRLEQLNRVSICEDIEMFFHRNSNLKLTVDHYIQYYKGHFTRKIIDLKAFRTGIESIYRILAENDYIKSVNTDSKTNKLREYIRRENIEVKSVMGKKLLTLASI